MKIDIHITDATEEEARKFFSWNETVRAADRLLSTMMEGARQMDAVAKRPAPDPTCDEETGCAGCDRDLTACPECSPPPAPAPTVKPSAQAIASSNDVKEPPTPAKKPDGRANKFGIPPSLFTEDKRKYSRLWSRCKKHGLTYEQALELEKDIRPGTPHAKAVIERTPKPGQLKIREATKALNGSLQIGQKVKHNGSKGSPHFGQVGEITAINKEELRVKFPTGDARLPSYLVLAMPEEAK